ncbi:filamentous hemagglutinin N-terminal domain-containing protein [Ramlibacter sp.]|uniref:two-partner secretion domain-containing protein n=1 Tax=Ramlibacter sp. TaxID=1917967 RepID=UPI002624031F|nr:filamentous hemagglutinin N-terminal domain-containing protein [Ramlibacter sp.]
MPAPFPLSLVRRAAGVACACGLAAGAWAQPSGLSPLHGSAVVQTAGNVTTVVTTNGAGTNRSALDWRSFGVPGGSTVFFSQPNTASLSINRVLGGDPSSIAGTLGSNGHLVLVNPAGIAVAPGAVIDTAGFTASTLGMSRSDAIAGRLSFGGKDSDRDFASKSGSGRLEVRGQVLARNGDVVLIGADLETDSGAVVQAIAGDVVLAAGHSVEVTGRGLEGILMQVRAPGDRAVNLGTLRGDSVAIFAGQLRHSGVVQADSASNVGGRVVLQASDAAEIDGSIEASALAHGGSVLVSAAKVTLKAPATINVSHAKGGGEILVGGGWQGQDSRVANARQVAVEQGVLLTADATLRGDGGMVVVWSEQSTRFAGTILSRGAGGGAGGRVEVSGAHSPDVRGTVDVIGGAVPASTTDGKGKGKGDSGADGNGNGADRSGNSGKGNGSDDPGSLGSSGGRGNGSGDDPAARRLPGHPFDPASVSAVALVPREAQPEAVQAALREPAAATDGFIQRTSAALAAAAPSDPGDASQRKVVVNETQCAVVTR